MGRDTCPECGEPYIKMVECDARPGGALFECYVHAYENNDWPGNHITESCDHILEWGEESSHA